MVEIEGGRCLGGQLATSLVATIFTHLFSFLVSLSPNPAQTQLN